MIIFYIPIFYASIIKINYFSADASSMLTKIVSDQRNAILSLAMYMANDQNLYITSNDLLLSICIRVMNLNLVNIQRNSHEGTT